MQIVNDFETAFGLSIVSNSPTVDDLCMMNHQLLIVKSHIRIINLPLSFNCEVSPSNRRLLLPFFQIPALEDFFLRARNCETSHANRQRFQKGLSTVDCD